MLRALAADREGALEARESEVCFPFVSSSRPFLLSDSETAGNRVAKSPSRRPEDAPASLNTNNANAEEDNANVRLLLPNPRRRASAP